MQKMKMEAEKRKEKKEKKKRKIRNRKNKSEKCQKVIRKRHLENLLDTTMTVLHQKEK